MAFRFVFGGGQGVIYAISNDGDMYYYRDEGRNGTGVWSFGGKGQRVGQGWQGYQRVFSGGNGIIYAIDPVGHLFFYRDEARNGNGVWSFGGQAKQIGQGWDVYRYVFGGDDGVIYAIDDVGRLFYYRDESRNGDGRWSFGGTGQQIGEGWTQVRHVFSGGQGIIYAVTRSDDLLFYRDEARNGKSGWAFAGIGQPIGSGWQDMKQVLSGDDGIIYAIDSAGKLLFYRDEARNGQSRWSFGGIGKPIGEGWTAIQSDYQLTSRWACCIATFGGATRGTSLSANWATRAFGESEGVAGYVSQMSGGRERVVHAEFGPIELMSIRAKKAADTAGTTIQDFRSNATRLGLPVDQFDHWMWLIDDGISTLGTTPSDSLVGALDFTPQNAMHELTHATGVCSHADRASYDDYGDAFCVMGAARGARSFVNPNLVIPTPLRGDDSHALSGPGIGTPYLYAAGWLDLVANAVTVPITGASGSTVTLDANQGAPRFLSRNMIGLLVGNLPRRIGDPAAYWIEYRHPSAFDRNITRPVNGSPDLPATGVVILRKVEVLGGVRCSGSIHSYLVTSLGALDGNTLSVPGGYTIRVQAVDVMAKRIQLRIA